MKKFWSTFRLFFISTYFTWRGKGGRWEKQAILWLLLALAFLPLMRILFAMYQGVYAAGVMLGTPDLILLLAAFAGQSTVLVFAVPYLLSAFYYTDDLLRLASLPLAQWQLLGPKFALVWLNEVLTLLIFVGPAYLVYGLSANPSLLYWPLLLLLLLLLPTLPLALAALFTIALVRVTNLPRHRDLLQVVGGLTGIVLALGLQTLIIRSGNDPGLAVQDALVKASHLVKILSRRVPPAALATQTLTAAGSVSGLLAFILFALVSLAAVAVFGLIAQYWFWHSFLAGQEVTLKRERRGRKTGRRGARQRGPLAASFLREVRLFLRTPAFAFNGLLSTVIVPIIIIFPMLVQGTLGSIRTLVQSGPSASPIAGLILAAAVAFSASMNQVTSTAVSREGKLFFWSRVLPLSPCIQIQAKLLFGLFILALNALVWFLLAHLVVGIPGVYAVGGAGIGFLASVATASIGLLVDLYRPHLDWSDPQRAMKGNFNALIASLLGWLLLGLGALLSYLLLRLFHSLVIVYWVAAVFFVLASLGLYAFLLNQAESLYRGIQQ
ncbi:MAG: hypothetical protein ACOX2S_06750 [bacterium]|jgi:ABC-2 type transport system permease protein